MKNDNDFSNYPIPEKLNITINFKRLQLRTNRHKPIFIECSNIFKYYN